MSRKTVKILFAIAIVAAIYLIVAITSDFNLALQGKRPVFCILESEHKEGNGKEYIGLGYKIIKYKQQDGKTVVRITGLLTSYDRVVTSTLTTDIENKYDMIGKIQRIDIQENEKNIYVVSYEKDSKYSELIIKLEDTTKVYLNNKLISTDNLLVDQTVGVKVTSVVTKSIPGKATAKAIYIQSN